MEYILNDSVIFHEAEGLRYKHQTQVAVQMSVLQAGVMAEIIKGQGKPIHRNVLLDRVWAENGYPASNNSLNHNIAFLRNSLKEFGIQDAIVTVHRVGFKLGEMIDVKVNHLGGLLSKENIDKKDCEFFANEVTAAEEKDSPLNNKWRCFCKIILKNKLILFFCALLPLILMLGASIPYLSKSAGETQHYVATVLGCRAYSVYTLDDEQKGKYRRYAEYYLKSQSKGCTPNDILLMYVQDEHGLRETVEGNNRAFFAICNFDKKRADFCLNSYFYSMVPQ